MRKTPYIQKAINKMIAGWYGCENLEQVAQQLKAKSNKADKAKIEE